MWAKRSDFEAVLAQKFSQITVSNVIYSAFVLLTGSERGRPASYPKLVLLDSVS